MSRKLGFWAVFAIVTGSQIGSGVFMLPVSLAPYGFLGLGGWAISCIGAIALALVFAELCAWYPKTGGPHAYVKEAFGNFPSFFTGWTYWVISWVSSTAVVISSIGYLTPLFGAISPTTQLLLEIALLILITSFNLKSVNTAGNIEFVLTVLKIIPLVLMPLAALFFFDAKNFVMDASATQKGTSHILSHATLITLWGFIGLELATTAAGSVENPTKTIPKALIFGTICVAIIYLINSVAIMGVTSGPVLMHSKAPYADAAQYMFNGNWHMLISFIAAIVCIGSLNAWMLASGQIAFGLAEDNLLPAFFARKNKNDAPTSVLFLTCGGMIALLFLMSQQNIAQQINTIIDFSVIAFLFVYLICSLAFLKMLPKHKSRFFWLKLTYGLIAVGFCSWIIYETALTTTLIASIFSLSGVPVYYFHRQKLCKALPA